ncbi:MAG: DUF501 domain-containing protein [Acidimicrobiales bacterium]
MAALLGRPPRGGYEVAVRAADGSPLVLRNDPLLLDGTPMPTRWWLVGRAEREAVSRLEAEGGVREAAGAVDPMAVAAAHVRYAAERDAALPDGHRGPRPSGGVGGTRRGVKCLHAHLAWHLAGGDDPVGRWVADHLAIPSPAAAPVAQSSPGAGGWVLGANCVDDEPHVDPSSTQLGSRAGTVSTTSHMLTLRRHSSGASGPERGGGRERR